MTQNKDEIIGLTLFYFFITIAVLILAGVIGDSFRKDADIKCIRLHQAIKTNTREVASIYPSCEAIFKAIENETPSAP